MSSTQSISFDGPVRTQQAGARHGALLLLASVMPAMAIISLVPVLPQLEREFADTSGSAFLVPIALTIPALCVALFSPLAGWLSDRLGRKWLLVAALLAYAGVGVVPFFLTDLGHIILARIGLGVTEAVIMTVATALIGDYFEGERRERWIAAQVAVVSISAIVLVAIGGALGQALGSRGPFLLYLLAIPAALAIALILFDPPATSGNTAERVKLPIGSILPLLLVTLVSGVFFYTVVVQLGPILELTGAMSPAVIGIVGAAVNTGTTIGAFAFSRLKGFSGPRLMAIGLAIVALGYGGMGLSQQFAVTALFATVTSIGAGMLLPTLLAWILQLLPEPVRGRGSGLWTGMFFLGQFAAPILATAVAGPANGLANVLLVWAGLALIGAMIALWRTRSAVALAELRPN